MEVEHFVPMVRPQEEVVEVVHLQAISRMPLSSVSSLNIALGIGGLGGQVSGAGPSATGAPGDVGTATTIIVSYDAGGSDTITIQGGGGGGGSTSLLQVIYLLVVAEVALGLPLEVMVR